MVIAAEAGIRSARNANVGSRRVARRTGRDGPMRATRSQTYAASFKFISHRQSPFWAQDSALIARHLAHVDTVRRRGTGLESARCSGPPRTCDFRAIVQAASGCLAAGILTRTRRRTQHGSGSGSYKTKNIFQPGACRLSSQTHRVLPHSKRGSARRPHVVTRERRAVSHGARRPRPPSC